MPTHLLRSLAAAAVTALVVLGAAADASAAPIKPDLTISLSAAPNPVDANALVVYTINVGNPSYFWCRPAPRGTCEPIDMGAPASNVVVRDTLPGGVSFLSAYGSHGFSCSHSGGVVTCSGGYVDVDDQATLTITVRTPNAGGTLTNTAQVDPFGAIAERSESNNVASTTVTVRPPLPAPKPDLTISNLTQSVNPQFVNGNVTYTMQVRNLGPGNASDVRAHWNGGWGGFTQYFEGSFSADSGFQCYIPADSFHVEIRCVGGAIAAGQTATITITARGPSAAGTFTVRATADPYSQIVETNESNNQAQLSQTFN